MALIESGRSGFGGAAVAAILLALLSTGCNRSDRDDRTGGRTIANATARTAPAEPSEEANGGSAKEESASADEAPAEQDEERRGPSRQARCRIDDEPEQACTFTQVLGDGSFDIETPDRQLRLVVDGDEAAPFELIGERRIPIVGLLRRDPNDRACWVADGEDAVLQRVCAR